MSSHSYIPSIESTLKNQLNKSISKQQFSFPKANRFKTTTKPQHTSYVFYQIPTTASQRATSFGLSKKTDFAVHNNVPPPDQYHLPGEFERPSTKGMKFRVSRENAKSYSFLKILDNPGPGAYHFNPQVVQPKIAYQFSIGKQNPKHKIPEVPGPGTYQIKSPLLDQDKFLSKDRKNACPKIVTHSNRKMKTQQSLPTILYNPKVTSKGQKVQFGGKGYSISKQQRFTNPSKNNMIPPPGQYQTFSQFIQSRKLVNH